MEDDTSYKPERKGLRTRISTPYRKPMFLSLYMKKGGLSLTQRSFLFSFFFNETHLGKRPPEFLCDITPVFLSVIINLGDLSESGGARAG